MSVHSVKNSDVSVKGALVGSLGLTHEPSPSPFLPIRSDRGWGRPLPGRVVRVPAVYPDAGRSKDPLLGYQNGAPDYGAFAPLYPPLPKCSVESEFLQSEFQIDLTLRASRTEIAFFNSGKLSSRAKDHDFRKRLEKEIQKLRQIEADADKPNGIPPECREQMFLIRANLHKLEEILETLQKYDDCNCLYDTHEQCSWYFTGCVHEKSCPMGVCARLVCTVTCPIWGALACLSACNAKICEGLLGPQRPEDLKYRPGTPPKLVYTQYAVASTPANPRGFGYQIG